METPLTPVTRRTFLNAAALGSATIAACAPAAAPPSPAPAAGGSPAESAGWQAEWDKLVSAAKGEGTLALITLTGAGYRTLAGAFEEAQPGIKVNHQSFSSASQVAPRVEQERKAGVYAWDIAILNTTTALKVMRPQGVWDPIRPAIFRPDVTGDRNWADGFEAGFVDIDKKWTYSFSSTAGLVAINTDQLNESDIKSVQDLADPKWRGKVLWGDVRWGGTFWPMTAVRLSSGDEMVKRLIVDQQPVFQRDTRQMVETTIRGGIAISNALRDVMREFWDKGVGTNFKYIQVPGYSYVSGQAFFLFNQPAHPSAAKVFVNWLLTKDGQTAYSKALNENSRRTDVTPVNPDTVPVPGRKYVAMHAESVLAEVDKTQELLQRLVGITN